MARLERLFATPLYRAQVPGARALNQELKAACYATATDDLVGQQWCKKNGYPGYTSHGSLDDLPWRYPAFRDLAKVLNRHAKAFAKALAFDLRGRPLTLDSLWINILPPGGLHTSHIHPASVISGTYYVAVPSGAAALKFEDPRSGRMMAAPPRLPGAPRDLHPFIYEKPAAGTLLLWESWLRHEVPLNRSKGDRISISFNYRWGD